MQPKVDAVFGLHVFSAHGLGTAGSLMVRPGGIMAASDRLAITVKGRQTHGAQPWSGVDPDRRRRRRSSRDCRRSSAGRWISRPARWSSRSARSRAAAATTSCPRRSRMTGTLRSFDPDMRRELRRRVEQTATRIAESAGAVAEVRMTDGTPVTWNDPALTSATHPVAPAGGQRRLRCQRRADDACGGLLDATRRRCQACSFSWASIRRAPIRHRWLRITRPASSWTRARS